MAGFEEVLERLVGDEDFRRELAHDPQAALAEYTLSEGELRLLAMQLDGRTGEDHAVEQRSSKSALFMLLASGLDARPQASAPGGPVSVS